MMNLAKKQLKSQRMMLKIRILKEKHPHPVGAGVFVSTLAGFSCGEDVAE